jgi:hypothetical protein
MKHASNDGREARVASDGSTAGRQLLLPCRSVFKSCRTSRFGSGRCEGITNGEMISPANKMHVLVKQQQHKTATANDAIPEQNHSNQDGIPAE